MPTLTQAKARLMGIPEDTIQTIEIPLRFTLEDSQSWLKSNGYLWQNHRRTKNFRRFIQTPDIKGATYYSVKIPNNIVIVHQKYDA